ncbi:methyltransferase [Streptomyces goshikiensis]|uniref:methyltransferase n=1 Tax=Streptomyces goshikiensis TaxID=1942 RepID=UPI00368387A1
MGQLRSEARALGRSRPAPSRSRGRGRRSGGSGSPRWPLVRWTSRPRRRARITPVDVSWRAVATARLNALRQRLPVRLFCGDFASTVAGSRFDLVVANSPYVPAPVAGLPCASPTVLGMPAATAARSPTGSAPAKHSPASPVPSAGQLRSDTETRTPYRRRPLPDERIPGPCEAQGNPGLASAARIESPEPPARACTRRTVDIFGGTATGRTGGSVTAWGQWGARCPPHATVRPAQRIPPHQEIPAGHVTKSRARYSARDFVSRRPNRRPSIRPRPRDGGVGPGRTESNASSKPVLGGQTSPRQEPVSRPRPSM